MLIILMVQSLFY